MTDKEYEILKKYRSLHMEKRYLIYLLSKEINEQLGDAE